MELKNYYKLIFSNQQEYFVETNIDNIVGFLNTIDVAGDFIPLQLKEGDPVYFKTTQLLSVQKARAGIVGAQTKLWSLA